MKFLPRDLELEIFWKTKPYLEKGRGGDVEHVKRLLYMGSYLLPLNIDPRIVRPALIMHDAGYGKVFSEFPEAMKWPRPKIRDYHMKYGSEITKNILYEVGYHKKYDEWITKKIIEIISIHDLPKKVFDQGDPNAVFVTEVDRLDRYLPSRFDGLKESIPGKSMDWIVNKFLRSGLDDWFTSDFFKSMARKFYNNLNEMLERGML